MTKLPDPEKKIAVPAQPPSLPLIGCCLVLGASQIKMPNVVCSNPSEYVSLAYILFSTFTLGFD